MKKILFALIIFLPFAATAQMTVGGRTAPQHEAVAVDIQTPKGILIPRMTYTQKRLLAVDSTLAGLTVYQTDQHAGFYLWDGKAWMNLMPLESGTGDSLSAASFAEVAFSGNYNDLKNRPVILAGSHGEPLAFAPVAVTGDYNDLKNLPVILTDIPTLHQVAYSGSYADLSGFPTIRTHLKDFESDMYYMLTDSATVKVWETAARQAVPTKIADLSEDYTHQSVTDADIRRWEAASGRYIPTQLRELIQDSAHRTLTQTQIAAFTEAADRYIPVSVSDLATDYSHLIVTEQEASSWDASVTAVGFSGDYNDLVNRPVIPDSLCQIMSDDFYQTVSTDDKARWSSMTGRVSRPYLTDLISDADHQIPTTRQVSNWNTGASREYPEISRAARTGDYNDLPSSYKYQVYSKDLAATGKFEYINSLSNDYPTWAPVAVTGDYNDLNGRPDELYKGKENILYSQLVDTPKYTKVAVTGNYNDLTDVAEYKKMSHYKENTYAVHVSKAQHDSLRILTNTLKSSATRNNSDFQGPYNNLHLKGNITLQGQPTIGTNNYNPDNPAAIATFKLAAELDRKAQKTVDSIADALVPEGSIIFWYNVNKSAIPDCWEVLDNIAGRFPVGLGGESGTFGILGATGGEEQHVLTGKELPAHRHSTAKYLVKTSYADKAHNGYRCHFFGNSFSCVKKDECNDCHAYTSEVAITPEGENKAHENRPPYFALYILKKSKAACRSNKQ